MAKHFEGTASVRGPVVRVPGCPLNDQGSPWAWFPHRGGTVWVLSASRSRFIGGISLQAPSGSCCVLQSPPSCCTGGPPAAFWCCFLSICSADNCATWSESPSHRACLCPEALRWPPGRFLPYGLAAPSLYLGLQLRFCLEFGCSI